MSDRTPKFAVVNDRSMERKVITMEELGECQAEGFRVEDPAVYERALVASAPNARALGGTPSLQYAILVPDEEKVVPGEAQMRMQGTSDEQMSAVNAPDAVDNAELSDNPLVDTDEAKQAEADAEEAGFFDREDAVAESTVEMAPEEVVQVRNTGKRRLKGELTEPVLVVPVEPADSEEE